MTRSILLLSLISFLAGCGTATKSSPREALRVAAASDLQTVMPQLIERFRRDHGIEVVATFGSSGQLSQQVKQGAPFDVFLCANRKFVVELAANKAIDPLTVRDYSIGSLVLAVREDLADQVKSLDDLRQPIIKKIAIANPETAPYGLAAKQALSSAGLWDQLASKRVQAETVRQTLQFLQTGNVEAALVGSAIAKVEGVRAFPIAQDQYEVLWQALGVTTISKQPEAAREFAEFVRGPEGKAILESAGFRHPNDFGK